VIYLRARANKGVAEDAKAPSAGAKSLCIPFDQKRFGAFPDGENQKCIQCEHKAKSWTLFGRSECGVCWAGEEGGGG
jgi:prolyl-tRNA synthetase